jgi:hypothetical protein
MTENCEIWEFGRESWELCLSFTKIVWLGVIFIGINLPSDVPPLRWDPLG